MRPNLLTGFGVVVIAFVILGTFAVAPASAARRLALVIDNSSYANAPKLETAADNAARVAASLTAAGFEVTRMTDAPGAELKRVLQGFAPRSSEGTEWAFIYYVGYSRVWGTREYLIPVDADLGPQARIDQIGISLEFVTVAISRGLHQLAVLDVPLVNPDAVMGPPEPDESTARVMGIADQIIPTLSGLIIHSARPDIAAAGVEMVEAIATALPRLGNDPRVLAGSPRDIAERIITDVRTATAGTQTPLVQGVTSMERTDWMFVTQPFDPPRGAPKLSDREAILRFLTSHPRGPISDQAQVLLRHIDAAASLDADVLAGARAVGVVNDVSAVWSGTTRFRYDFKADGASFVGTASCAFNRDTETFDGLSTPVGGVADALRRLAESPLTGAIYRANNWAGSEVYPTSQINLETTEGTFVFASQSVGEYANPWMVRFPSGVTKVIASNLPGEVFKSLVAQFGGGKCAAWADSKRPPRTPPPARPGIQLAPNGAPIAPGSQLRQVPPAR